MSRNFSATTDKLRTTSFVGPPTTTGTVAFWIKPAFSPGDSTNYRLYEYWNSSGSLEFTMFRRFDNLWYFGWNNFGGDDRATFSDTGTFTSGTWIHILFTWDTGGSPHTNVYFDGSSVGSASGTLNTGTGFAEHHIGNSGVANNGGGCGDIAEVGMWNIVLDAGQRAALAAGVAPILVAPAALVQDSPLLGYASPETGRVAGTQYTVTGATKSAHPRIFYPRRPSIITAPAAALAGNYSPLGLSLAGVG